MALTPQNHHVGSSGHTMYNLTTKIIMNGQEVPDGEVRCILLQKATLPFIITANTTHIFLCDPRKGRSVCLDLV